LAVQSPLPKTVGVTGGIGSGKTAVCAVFAELGLPILSADAIARELSESDPGLRKRIVKLLGGVAYLSNGTYNRSYVAERIFSDRTLQRRLESVVHPAVERELRTRLRQAHSNGHNVAVVEAALVFEAGMDRWLDVIVVVDAPEELRLRRVTERDDSTDADVRRRMRAQLSTEAKRKRADFVIVNDGTREELERNVKFVYVLAQELLGNE